MVLRKRRGGLESGSQVSNKDRISDREIATLHFFSSLVSLFGFFQRFYECSWKGAATYSRSKLEETRDQPEPHALPGSEVETTRSKSGEVCVHRTDVSGQWSLTILCSPWVSCALRALRRSRLKPRRGRRNEAWPGPSFSSCQGQRRAPQEDPRESLPGIPPALLPGTPHCSSGSWWWTAASTPRDAASPWPTRPGRVLISGCKYTCLTAMYHWVLLDAPQTNTDTLCAKFKQNIFCYYKTQVVYYWHTVRTLSAACFLPSVISTAPVVLSALVSWLTVTLSSCRCWCIIGLVWTGCGLQQTCCTVQTCCCSIFSLRDDGTVGLTGI